MWREDGRVVYSPSDLVTFLGSPYASWMEQLHLERPEAATPGEEDESSAMLARRGEAHERAILGRLSAGGRRVATIARSPRAFDATREALGSGADVVYQAALTDGIFAGYADFVVRGAAGAYEVWDAKLSRSGRPKHVLQLCAYADLLRHATDIRANTLVLALGDGEVMRLRAADFHWYYLTVRDAFLALMARFDPDAPPPDPEPNADHGRWESAAAAWFEERDHLVRVAGIRRSQIARLAEAGITTLTSLAETDKTNVRGIGRDVLPRLVRQARLQLASAGKDHTVYEVLRPTPDMLASGLALLPPASPNDVFFDLEGFPLEDDGLEYLWGALTVDTGAPLFRDWWARDAAGERRAFEAFVDFAIARWRADRSMHIYHYASYEVTALRRLTGKYGAREDEVDALLRGNVFVDLLPVVRQGLAIGEPAYSLKNVEHLYRGAREGDVRDAAASMVEYDKWLESGEGPDWRASPILEAIRDYNTEDCTSMWQLAVWLREQQRAASIAYAAPGGAEPEPEHPLSEENQRRLDLGVAMLAEAAAMPTADEAGCERRRIHELLAHLVEFHRREEKPQWWALFDAAKKSHEELGEDVDCLGDIRLVEEPKQEKKSFAVTYSFEPDQDTKVDEKSKVRFSHAIDVEAEVIAFDRDAGRVTLKIGPSAWAKLDGHAPEHTSLVPFTIVPAGTIKDAIEETVTAWRTGAGIPRALDDFLHRRPPRVRGHGGGRLLRPGEKPLDGALRVVSNLEDSCVVVQGPPGTGKTFTAAHVIAALVSGPTPKNVGITSNSHKAIENLLAACNRAAGAKLPFLKAGGEPDSPLVSKCVGFTHCKNNGDARGDYTAGLVGGTAWLFARPEWKGTLDYLFVDEAGQVSLANLVAIARSTRNLVLLGDQMQLSQPTQGTHPGESGLSLLDYYLRGRPTIPDDLGLFLGETRRLHPTLCEFISEAVYEGRLRATDETKTRTIAVPADAELVRRAAGLVFLPVEHEGNAQASDEEVDAIRRVVGALAGRAFTDPKQPRKIALDDLLFVAPYNAQVRRLRAALADGARVGSVDKFQGQEAPIVVISMCASPGEFGPRGSAFLLDIQRLNVAISRAQSLAVVVGDPRLAHGRAGSIDEMRRLNLLCRLCRV